MKLYCFNTLSLTLHQRVVLYRCSWVIIDLSYLCLFLFFSQLLHLIWSCVMIAPHILQVFSNIVIPPTKKGLPLFGCPPSRLLSYTNIILYRAWHWLILLFTFSLHLLDIHITNLCLTAKGTNLFNIYAFLLLM